MKELIEECKNCLGCNRLEDENFIGDKNCIYIIKEKEYARKKRSNRKNEKI